MVTLTMFDRRMIVFLSLALLTLLASACGTDTSHPAEFPGTPSPAQPRSNRDTRASVADCRAHFHTPAAHSN